MFLWQSDRQQALQTFMKNNPNLNEFENKLKELEFVSVEIRSVHPMIAVGPIAVFTG